MMKHTAMHMAQNMNIHMRGDMSMYTAIRTNIHTME